MSALSYKAIENNLVVVDDFSFEAPKTKNYLSFVNNLNFANSKTLLVMSEQNKNVYLASRNLPKAKVITASELSTYVLLNSSKLLLTTSAVKIIEESFAK